MKQTFYLIKQYLKYYFRSVTLYKVHSPLVFDFCEKVLDHRVVLDEYKEIEALRKQLLDNKTPVTITDLGAGSRTGPTKTRRIQQIAYNAVSPTYQCEILHKITRLYNAKSVLEMGTSLGISAAYLSIDDSVQINTLEGCPNTADLAREVFKELDRKNISISVGDFKKTYLETLAKNNQWDIIYIDGNHQYQPTLDYFEQAKQYLHNDSIIIFDDIYWSQDMTKAWEAIKADPTVTLSLDLFFFGIVYFKKEIKQKQHLTLIGRNRKPIDFHWI